MGDNQVPQTAEGGSVRPCNNEELGTSGAMCGIPTNAEDQENVAEGALGNEQEGGQQYDRLVSVPKNPIDVDEPPAGGHESGGCPSEGDAVSTPHKSGGSNEDAGSRGARFSSRSGRKIVNLRRLSAVCGRAGLQAIGGCTIGV